MLSRHKRTDRQATRHDLSAWTKHGNRRTKRTHNKGLKFCAGRHESPKGIQKHHRKRKTAAGGEISRYKGIICATNSQQTAKAHAQRPKNATQRTNGTHGERIHHSKHKTQYSPLYKPHIIQPFAHPLPAARASARPHSTREPR